uniref:Acid-sensing ion channel 1 n=1 Tax=Macrostomum lignano TaxID=282301 RepID=A0A1I8HTM6_9PLAT
VRKQSKMASSEQQKQSELSDSLLQQLRENALIAFAQQTTAHGLVRLTQGSGLRRLIWALAIVGACIGFSVHLAELAQRYLSYPVSTEFSNEGADFKFPTVTICPTNFITYYSPDIVSNFTVSGHPRGLSDMIFDIPRMYHLLQQADWNVSMPVQAYSSYQDGKLALRALAYRQMLFQQPYETVIYCRYNSELCSFKNFTIYKDESRFLCMSFNPANRTLVRSGEGNGLYLVLFNYGKTFLTEEEQIDNVPGFRVTLHEKGFKPDLNSGFTVPFGYKTSAEVTVRTDTKLNREAAPCSDVLPNATYTVDFSWPDGFENRSFFGSTRDCITRLMQEEFKATCSCLGTHLALPSDLMSDTGVCHSLPEELFFFDIFYKTNEYKLREYKITNSTWDWISLASYLLSNWQVYNATANMIACYRRVRYRQETQGVATTRCPVRCSNTRYG